MRKRESREGAAGEVGMVLWRQRGLRPAGEAVSIMMTPAGLAVVEVDLNKLYDEGYRSHAIKQSPTAHSSLVTQPSDLLRMNHITRRTGNDKYKQPLKTLVFREFLIVLFTHNCSQIAHP